MTAREVIQTGIYLNMLGPTQVYVRFRCSRCKRVGEQQIQESEWDPSILQQPEVQLSNDDQMRFEQMGEIAAEEVIDFHYALERLSVIPEKNS